MVKQQLEQMTKDLATLYKTFFFDLPLAGIRWGTGVGSEQETTTAAWKGYDAGIRLATTSLDTLTRTPLFGEMTARSLDLMVRSQHVSNALTGAFFAGLWQTVGLPTAAETQSLRVEMQTLREEVRALQDPAAIQVKKKQTPKNVDQHAGIVQPMRVENGIIKSVRSVA